MTSNATSDRTTLSIVLAGEAGSGIQTIESILTQAFRRTGFHVFASKEYMSRIRGGSNSTLIRIGTHEVRAWSDRIDLCIPLGTAALAHLEDRLGPETIILADRETVKTDRHLVDTGLMRMASELGNAVFANTLAAGIIWGLFELSPGILDRTITDHFSRKDPQLLETIRISAKKGYEKGQETLRQGGLDLKLPALPASIGRFFLTGAEAIGTGCIAGGCNFVSSYPMSPGTGVLTFLAGHAREFDIAVEQAEDEIGAANMILGAWYAGARGLATTSGGGFSLMTEAVSLAGMIETPMVIHLAQRPGPATGLPTRTEQGDLDLALYAGHGEFPRAIFAPGNIEQALTITRWAFDKADSWQVPTILLTDQYFMDSCYDVGEMDLSGHSPTPAIIETTVDYQRYAMADDGVSPRGIPGWGTGLVCVDSDEHDEKGFITESPQVRRRMVEKRLNKAGKILKESLPPDLYGKASATNLLICWGSTLEPLREAVERIADSDVAILHFTQVFPVPTPVPDIVRSASKAILVEGNATGQFGRLLKSEWNVEWSGRILKYDGLPFSVEELQRLIESTIEREVGQ